MPPLVRIRGGFMIPFRSRKYQRQQQLQSQTDLVQVAKQLSLIHILCSGHLTLRAVSCYNNKTLKFDIEVWSC